MMTRTEAELEYWKRTVEAAREYVEELDRKGRIERQSASSLLFILSDYGLDGFLIDHVDGQEEQQT